jgi:NAD+ kinase
VILSRVLILIKWMDDELLQAASEAVRELTSRGDLIVMLPPDVAAKFKHYYGVDNDKIELFELHDKSNNGNHMNDKILQTSSDEYDIDGPDLVCTLGGDGLLMYASHLFPGPCPPILCVAGGSLGFLTPFARDEMVDSIRISLGLKVSSVADDNDQFYYDGQSGESNSWYDGQYDEYTPEFPPYIASKMKPSYVDEDGITWTGSYRVPRDDVEMKKKKNPRIKFGSNNQICLSTRMRLECLVINSEGVVRAKFNVLNEVVIDRGSSPYLAALECFCDNVHLTTVQADGVIFSTPTGSTAYSMAAGGSVVHPAVPAILVTPICPHVLSFRSMVFPDHVVLRCYVPEDARSDASVAFDGKHRRELHRGDSVQIQMSSYPVPTINRVDHSADWLTSLKRNFNFNTRIRQSPL